MAEKRPRGRDRRDSISSILNDAAQLGDELDGVKQKLESLVVDLEIWVGRGDEPSSLLRELFAERTGFLSNELQRFGSLIDRKLGFATLADVEEHFWERRKVLAAGFGSPDILDVDIYLDTNSKAAIVQADEALDELLTTIGADIVVEAPEIWSSWRKRLAAKVKQAEALEKAAEALKAAMVNLPQAQANSENADAVSKLIGSIGATPNAVLRFGPILIVKITVDSVPAVVTTELSRDQQRELNRHPAG